MFSFFLIYVFVASIRVAQHETPKMENNVHFYYQVVTFFLRNTPGTLKDVTINDAEYYAESAVG